MSESTSGSTSSEWVKTKLPVVRVEALQVQGAHPVQEDYLELNPERGIFLLADGFGGDAGREAAEMVVQSVKQFLEQEAGDLDATLPFEIRSYFSLAGNVLFNAVAFANQTLQKKNVGRNWLESGGASLIAGYLDGSLLAIANVGACRAFLSRSGKVKEIVSPKSLARQVNPFEEEVGRSRFVPLMSFGTAKQLEPEISEFQIKPGDRLCFQTAGIPETLTESIFKNDEFTSESLGLSSIQDNASFIWVGF